MDIDSGMNGTNNVCHSPLSRESNCKISEDYHYESIAAEKEDLDSFGEFCFETPRLAYKANNDYKNLLQFMVMLKAQHLQAKEDKLQLMKQKEEALANPLLFLEKLKEKKISFPKPQKVLAIPVIDWSKYDITGHKASFERRQIKHLSSIKSERQRKRKFPDTVEDCEYDVASNFNQLWTDEEQKKLEELLIEFPPEEIESRRWEKIAFAIGTRTPRQVASRVQKYFLKLMKSGDPIPGRMPSRSSFLKAIRSQKYQRPQPTSSDIHIDHQTIPSETVEVSDEEDISPELRNTPQYEELMLVKKILKMKVQHSEPSSKQCTK